MLINFWNQVYICRNAGLQFKEIIIYKEKKKDICLSPKPKKISTATENSKKQCDNTKTPQKIDYTTIADGQLE